MNTTETARAAKQASFLTATASAEDKNRALYACADALRAHASELLAANAQDLLAAKDAALPSAALARLKLDDAKLAVIIQGLKELAALPDPVGRVLAETELDDGLALSKVSCPLGVLGVIFESRPDVLAQIAGLAVKSGNAVVLKGGREALHTNRATARVLQEALRTAGWPENALSLIESREAAAELLQLDEYVDLVIPRGGNALVRYVKQNTTIPVLGHADGVCHIYIAPDAPVAETLRLCLDAKTQYPAACNAVETLLVDQAWPHANDLQRALQSAGVRMHAAPEDAQCFTLAEAMPDIDWHTEYGALEISLKTVRGGAEAVEHINRYGSHHTDCILTQNSAEAETFLNRVDSAGVYHNASTRFADGFRYGFGAEVGISTGKTHARGPVGLEGLTIYKYKLRGRGQIVGDYAGPNAKKFTHKPLAKGGNQ